MTTREITVGDTDTLDVSVTPASALDGATIKADLWLGSITAATWSHRWDSEGDAPTGVSVEDGAVSLATSVIDWSEYPSGKLYREATLEIELTRGGSVETLPHVTVTIRSQRIA